MLYDFSKSGLTLKHTLVSDTAVCVTCQKWENSNLIVISQQGLLLAHIVARCWHDWVQVHTWYHQESVPSPLPAHLPLAVFVLKIGCSQVVAKQLPAAPGRPPGKESTRVPVSKMKVKERCSLDCVGVVVHSFNQFRGIMELARFEIRVYVISI